MSSEKKNNDYLLEVEHLKQYFRCIRVLAPLR